MTRAHVYDPPPHLADVAHEHVCERSGHTYACYGARHEPGSVRDCGSSLSACTPKPAPKTEEKECATLSLTPA